MSTEKANGTKVPDYITQMWVEEDRAIARGIAAMEKDQEAGIFPKFHRHTFPLFGKIMIFGTGGEMSDENREKLFNKPEGYNLIEE